MNDRGRTFLCLLYLKLTFYLHNMRLYQQPCYSLLLFIYYYCVLVEIKLNQSSSTGLITIPAVLAVCRGTTNGEITCRLHSGSYLLLVLKNYIDYTIQTFWSKINMTLANGFPMLVLEKISQSKSSVFNKVLWQNVFFKFGYCHSVSLPIQSFLLFSLHQNPESNSFLLNLGKPYHCL